MTQPNGLPGSVVNFDTITSHDWSDNSQWVVSVDDSTWTLQPDAGQAIKVTGVLIKFSEDMVVHANGGMLIQVAIDGWAPSPLTLVSYSSIADFFARADEWGKLDYNGPANGSVNKPIISLKFDFSRPVVLWSSGGTIEGVPKVDAQGSPKFQKMMIKIADDMPYKDNDGGVVQVARSRYFIECYADV
jgi:hypothetical protein